MSSNLFKSYYLNRSSEDVRVINSNEVIAQKLEQIGLMAPTQDSGTGGFEPVSFHGESDSMDPADMLSADYSPEGIEGENFEEGFITPVIKAGNGSQGQEVSGGYTGPTPEELLEQAKQEVQAEIEQMRTIAMQELETERMNVLNSAQASGYEEGKRLAMQEMESMRSQLEQERMHLQEAYEKQVDELEPLFVRTLTGIYEKVFEVGLDNQQEIVVTLLRNTMKKLDGCKNFLVHVSPADYPYVKENRELLLSESAQEGTVVDIVEDGMMRENECTIETVNGIYDCGIGTQLAELRKKLTLLSYEGRQES